MPEYYYVILLCLPKMSTNLICFEIKSVFSEYNTSICFFSNVFLGVTFHGDLSHDSITISCSNVHEYIPINFLLEDEPLVMSNGYESHI